MQPFPVFTRMINLHIQAEQHIENYKS
jgi:hypothetical protein